MSSTFLDLDKVVPRQREVKIEGVTYALKEMTTEWGLKAAQMEDRLRKGEVSAEELVDYNIGLIKASIPDLDVNALPARMVEPLVKFIVGVEDVEKKTRK